MKFVWILVGVLILTFFAFSSGLDNQLLNWDDDILLTDNPQVRSLSIKNIKAIFSSTVQEIYIPLSILSYAVEYHFFKFNSFVYHFNNLLLHLGVTGLVFYFALQLGLTYRAAGVAALLFGVHPMRVESVVWVTERKDVLYSLFYMLSLCQYMRYIKQAKASAFILTVFFGWLSVLSKPMAVSLPLILLLCDWFWGRRDYLKMIREKIPFIFYIVPCAWMALSKNTDVYSVNSQLLNSFLVMVWTFTFYLKKFLFSWTFIPLYEFPKPVMLGNWHYLSAVLFLAGLIALCIYFRKRRWIIFSVLFYVFSIFFLIRYDEAIGKSVVADRYMYLPSLGICLLAGRGAQRMAAMVRERKLLRIEYIFLVVVLFALMIGKTFKQSNVWQDNMSLWNYILKYYPQNPVALHNRAMEYAKATKWDLALNDYNQAIMIDPLYSKAYYNRGAVFLLQKQLDLAEQDLNTALTLNPKFLQGYYGRGILYLQTSRYAQAVDDLTRFIDGKPHRFDAYNERGKAYLNQKKWDKAIADFTYSIELNPNDPDAFFYRSLVLRAKNKITEAVQDAKRAKVLGLQNIDQYIDDLQKSLPSP